MASNMRVDPEKLKSIKSYCESIKRKVENGEALDASPPEYPYILGQFGSGFVLLKVAIRLLNPIQKY